MSIEIAFDEILLDPALFNLGFATGGPEFSNVNLRNPQTGVAAVAVLALDPTIVWQCDFEDIKHPDPTGLQYFLNMWLGGSGSAYGMRVRNQWDYLTQGEIIDSAWDGGAFDYKITKKYQRPGTTTHPYYRRIVKPVAHQHLSVDSVTLYEPDGVTARVPGSSSYELPFKVYLGGVEQTSGFTISNTTGTLHMNARAGGPFVLTVDYQFDTPMQFWVNRPGMKADFPAEAKGIAMIEVLPATLGIA